MSFDSSINPEGPNHMNQRKYKRGLAVLAVLALGVGVTACGGDDSSSDTTMASVTTMAEGGSAKLANFTPWDAAAAPVDCAPKDGDRKSTRLNSSHVSESRMPSSA